MTLTARLLTLLAVIFFAGACSHVGPTIPNQASPRSDAPPPPTLRPSPNHLVGRVLAVEAVRGFAFIELTREPPAAALSDGALLLARTEDLRETARLRTSRYVRGRTLGATIVSGQPSPGDEVVIDLP